MSTTPTAGAAASRGAAATLQAWLQAIRPGCEQSPGPLRLLVVDDDPFNHVMVSAQLARLGLVPLKADDGAIAVAYACELRFDLILMDLQMPVLDGLGATAAIRRFEAQQARPAVPVLAYSSAWMAASVLAAHGLSGRLSKPCPDAELLACLQLWCPGARLAAAAAPASARPAARALQATAGRVSSPVGVRFTR
jgi:CheY-like chemotaxis protein